MLKAIKTTKQMRLDELIKYIFDNEIESKQFLDDKKDIRVTVDRFGSVGIESNKSIYGPYVNNENLFTVEIEEPITEDTVFDELMCVYKRETLIKVHQSSINGIFKSNLEDEVNEIHALINGRLELVWESDGE